MRFLLWSLLLILNRPLYAIDNMLFSGTLIEPPPCKINEDGMVDVDFGDRVGVNKVDGVNYLQTLNYSITCEKGGNGLDLTLTLGGKQTTYDNAAIQTDVTDLGIRVLQNGQPFILDKPVVIDPKAPPKLQAVPVKTPGASLKEGAFIATATLKAEYQ
ncbi:fimbrial protein [Pantoea agglomerans]|uniref:Fimbrial protein n=1 Tax=Enterobacter agglomerans TaxID=549 RepID=A0ACC5RSE9_ENTAG|nr:fimbrial protein [Pantoea agglomerans]MBK4727653.1 fimbrial protein [Pantoea agglomerans]